MHRAASVFLVLIFSTVSLADDLTGVKCIVMGERAAKTKFASKHLDGEIYFCCPKCKSTFDSNPEKFLTKANHQLVITGQYVQAGCPSGGKEVDSKMMLKIGGVEVGFCSKEHYDKVKQAKDLASQAELVFGKKAFAKSFVKKSEIDLTKARCLKMPKSNVSKEHWVKYLEGKVFFCCEECKSTFEQDKLEEEFIRRANEQLFATGQYVQNLCPFSGGKPDGEHFVTINGNRIRMCCENCVDHMKSKSSDEEKAKTVFNEKTFKKSFTKKR